MAVRNLKTIKPVVWIPPSSTTSYRITIERKDGTIDDITELVTRCSVEFSANGEVGKFSFEIYDPTETYINSWTGNEIFRYYKDYSATATTLRFIGLIERPSKRGELKLKVTGSQKIVELSGIKVTKSYSAQEVSVILKDIIDTYATDYTYTNVDTTSTNLTIDWYEKPFFDCVKDLITASGYDCYIDATDDWHLKERGSVNNADEGIVHGYNLLEVEDFTPDLSQVRNRVVVYGADIEGIRVVYTAESDDATYGINSGFGIKTEIISDDNVITYEQARDLANFILADKISPPEVGAVSCLLLATLTPIDKIYISAPYNKLPPGKYQINGFSDEIDTENILKTTISLNKEIQTVSNIISERIQNENKRSNTQVNPYSMEYSYDFRFDSDTGSHTTTEITGGVLKVSSGASGTWVSNERELPSNISQAYLIVVGETLDGVSVSVSGDGGINYQSISNKELVSITTTGTSLRIKVEFSSADARVDSLSLQYKL